MNKGRRNELRDLKWKRRLKNLGLKRVNDRDFICYRDQGKPCSCAMCSPGKHGEKAKYTKDEERKIVSDFAHKFISSQRDIPPDIAKVVHEHFWEML